MTESSGKAQLDEIRAGSNRHADNKTRTAGRTVSPLEVQEPSQTNVAEDETQYPTGGKLWLILLSISLVLIVNGMDASIVSIAIPTMTDYWHTVADIGWYSAAYRLCMCAFQFMFGKLYKMFRVKRIFLISLAIFLVGSILCATAPTSKAFVVGRAVCGFAAAGIVAGVFTLAVQLFPLRRRALFVGIAIAVEGVSVIASPLLGGILIERLNWRWCFWINVPSAAVTWIIIAVFFRDIRVPEKTTWKHKFKELDLIGNLVFVPALTCLFLALSWAGLKYSWNSPTIIGLMCAFVFLLVVFAIDQWVKQDSATLPPSVLKNRSVLAGFIFSLTCISAMNVVEYYLPTYLQIVRGYSPGKSGYLMLPIIIGFLISAAMEGAGINIVGYYVPFMLAGSVLMPIFAGLMTTLTVESSLGTLIAYSGLFGFACGIGFQGPQVAVQNTLGTEDANMGLAVIIFAQHFGSAVFISAAQTIFTNRLSENLHQLVPGLNATVIENMGLTDLKNHVGAKHLQETLLGFDKSLMQTWYLAVGLTCATIVGSASMEWRRVKQKSS